MAIVSSQVTVTTTAAQIVAVDNVSQDIALHCGSGSCFIGSSSVTDSTGYKMDNGDKLRLTIREGENLHAITSAGTATLYILRSKVD
jgi:hypothetical protein